MPEGRMVRIGGASAGIGDGTMATPQLIRSGANDYVMLDYLSEYFMPVAGRARRQNPQAGYVMYFPEELFASVLPDMLANNVRMITNAGAVNPRACAAAMQAAAAKLGLSPKIAVVDGDDLLDRADAFRASGQLSEPLPPNGYTGINAYVGAFPIARALAMGADVVITGRVVDSALALGPLIHEFGWGPQDYDLLAAGSLVGHILECGAQASGGLFTDWREIEDYSNIGYPIAECSADGSAVITKPAGTGGLVSGGGVAEQMLYEIGDPRAYLLPDVILDFSEVHFEQVGEHRVRMTGAKGRAPGPGYKAIATWDDGFFANWVFPMRGVDAGDKARAIASSVLTRGARMLAERGLPQLRRTRVDVVGNEDSYGAQARAINSREVYCRVAIEAADEAAFPLIFREQGTGSVSMAPGIAVSRMMVFATPLARSESFLLPADEVPVTVTLGERREVVARASPAPASKLAAAPEPPPPDAATDRAVRLGALAWARSGDKGDICNIGIAARRPEYLPYIAAALDAGTMARFYAHMFADGAGKVERYYLPGSSALNFMLHDALDGGCTASMRFDPLGKSAAQEILDFEVPIPAALAP
jgi:hypothetical protein